jgi:coenzyme F420-reducing hydrogenase alpha subunit
VRDSRTVKVDYIARVEGQGALDITVDKDACDVKLKIFEPPRFFEAFLEGRSYDEVHELTSRICGVCPVAHQITSLRAVENALALEVSQQTRDLRKILALSAIVNSHVSSLYMFSVPDYFGKGSVLALRERHPQLVKRALRLRKLANDIGDAIGGRAVHPVYAVVKGFTCVPSRETISGLKERLRDARKDSVESARLFGGLDYPNLAGGTEQLAISERGSYAINEGMIRSTGGLLAPQANYRDHIREEQIPYSYAKGSTLGAARTFLVGPLARFNINFDRLSDGARAIAGEMGFAPPRYNPFDSLMARALEVVHSIDESIELMDRLPLREENTVHSIEPAAVRVGSALTEAPRGTLYHSFRFDKDARVEYADIVTPTDHNVKNIEKDLRELVSRYRDLPSKELTLMCEMLVRAYDPCISCSVH